MGHDGWLYLAMGDNGVDVVRPEGDRLVLHGGGILRCRPDGRDLHVFATGLRNIYDIALDADLNVFVRDNENDGGTYMIRVCHSFFGADHGYPYLYEEHPDEALPPLADLGLGSSAGGVCYLEKQFPAEYRGDLFFCEWGRSVVRYRPQRAGSGFAPLKEFEFSPGAADDPYGFKPTDIIVQRDGTMMVSDWADGQRPKRGRGRIYHIAYVGDGNVPPKVEVSNKKLKIISASSYERIEAQQSLEKLGPDVSAIIRVLFKVDRDMDVTTRIHYVWVVAHVGGPQAVAQLFELAEYEGDQHVRAQIVRAIADLADPVLVKHRLDAGAGDPRVAENIIQLPCRVFTAGDGPQVLLEKVVALGRLRWPATPDWLRQNLGKPDAALAHAAMQAMRRSENWPA